MTQENNNMSGKHNDPCDCLICRFCEVENPISATYASKLPLDNKGNIPSDRKSTTFYRVEDWKNGYYIADFAMKSEAERFAIEDAKAKGCQYDHKVCCIVMTKTS